MRDLGQRRRENCPGHESYGRMWLFVFAIALHNLPEGMAFGVSFSKGDMSDHQLQVRGFFTRRFLK
jgi:zinc transporter ZupT